jgi:uncharacterized cupredoxin-like copper-binding protein
VKKIALVLLGAVALVTAACSGSSAPPGDQGSSDTQTIRVSEGDMFLQPSTTHVAAGPITFDVTNSGKMDHEFVIVSGDPTGTTGEEPDRVSEANHVGGDEGPEIGNIPSGQSKDLTVNLKPGTYTAMCNLPGHFGSGMHFTFTVT